MPDQPNALNRLRVTVGWVSGSVQQMAIEASEEHQITEHSVGLMDLAQVLARRAALSVAREIDRLGAGRAEAPDLATRLFHLRGDSGLTLQDVADRTGLSVSYLSDMETGRAMNPSLEALRKLASCYGIATGTLLAGIEGC